MSEPLTGLGVSPGRVAGPVARMAAPPALPPPPGFAVGAGAVALAVTALEAVAADLRRRAALMAGEAAEVLEAQAMMAADPMLREEAERLAAGNPGAGVGDGPGVGGVVCGRGGPGDGPEPVSGAAVWAAHALDRAFARHRAALAELGGYFAERAADLDDLRNRAVAAALGRPMPGIPAPGRPFVLVAEDLSPADTVTLGPDVLAVVTERGGPTSHTAILARARALPAVVACAGATALADGELVAVDGTAGRVTPGLSEEEAETLRRGHDAYRERLRSGGGRGRTADGHAVPLLLNIGSAADVRDEDWTSAEGVGLFRTELLFLDRHAAPAPREQHAAYAEVFARCPKVVVRTLDAGTDKPLPFLGLDAEPNPALGIRGLRVDRVRPAVLDEQLAAIASAAERARAEVWVMAPMVATWQEAAAFARRARAAGLRRVGAMVEVPAAALVADRLLEHLDFLSVGTNDLGQYAFAADRQHPRLADLLDPRQPALLRLVAECARAGLAAGKPVGVCGEAAGDPAVAPLLVGLGVSSLSMSAACVPAVREALAGLTRERCRRAAERAMDPR